MAAEGWTPERVRSVLAGESPGLASQRRVFRHIPSPPRCKLCAAPFAGLGGFIFRHAESRKMTSRSTLVGCGLHVRGDDFNLLGGHLVTRPDTDRLRGTEGPPLLASRCLVGRPDVARIASPKGGECHLATQAVTSLRWAAC
jgi:hypothetical protein